MGRKSKAQQYDLVELIVSKHDGGKNTVVYVTDEVNRWLEENGLKIKFSRESIRRVIKTHTVPVCSGVCIGRGCSNRLDTIFGFRQRRNLRLSPCMPFLIQTEMRRRCEAVP